MPGQNGDKLAIIVELASENPAPQIEGIEQLMSPAPDGTVQTSFLPRLPRQKTARNRQI